MSSSPPLLTRRTPADVSLEMKDPVNPTALLQAKAIFDELLPTSEDGVKGGVNPGKLMEVARRLGDVPKDSENGSGNEGQQQQQYVVSPERCKAAFDSLSTEDRTTLMNIHSRIKVFAEAQRRSVVDIETDIPGGKAGHTVSACRVAGCYAPGGRYPLPSSVLMTAVTARAAGCELIVLASPRPATITLAAAHAAGADVVLCVGGAQAVAVMAHGIVGCGGDNGSTSYPSVPACDVIVGPGNQWVTAAKSIVSGRCGIDMLAGPSEVLVIADGSADAAIVAADLIAQAEHDIAARAILVSTSQKIIDDVDAEVARQLESLPEPNRSTARAAFRQSFSVLCKDIDECIAISDAIAPEHLEIQTVDSTDVGKRCANYGGLFIGMRAAEVLGDYGAGPNHTLPTGGTGRYTGGLSVFDFLRIRTWMRIDDAEGCADMVEDSVRMARLEGLEGHARAAEARRR